MDIAPASSGFGHGGRTGGRLNLGCVGFTWRHWALFPVTLIALFLTAIIILPHAVHLLYCFVCCGGCRNVHTCWRGTLYCGMPGDARGRQQTCSGTSRWLRRQGRPVRLLLARKGGYSFCGHLRPVNNGAAVAIPAAQNTLPLAPPSALLLPFAATATLSSARSCGLRQAHGGTGRGWAPLNLSLFLPLPVQSFLFKTLLFCPLCALSLYQPDIFASVLLSAAVCWYYGLHALLRHYWRGTLAASRTASCLFREKNTTHCEPGTTRRLSHYHLCCCAYLRVPSSVRITFSCIPGVLIAGNGRAWYERGRTAFVPVLPSRSCHAGAACRSA